MSPRPCLEQPERVVAWQHVGEEQPQQRLVPQLDRHLAAVQPVVERRPAVVRQTVEPAWPGTAAGILALDEPLTLEPLQLGIDLGVARGPEEPRRAIDDRLDLVAGARLVRQQPEDHPRRAALLHIP